MAPELAPDNARQGVTKGDKTTNLARQTLRKWRYRLRDGIRENGGKRISRPSHSTTLAPLLGLEPVVWPASSKSLFRLDVTDVLKRYNIPLTMAGGDEANTAVYDRLNTLPEDARRELERYGVIDWDTATGAEDKPLATTHWETHIAFYWFQTFPAGRPSR